MFRYDKILLCETISSHQAIARVAELRVLRDPIMFENSSYSQKTFGSKVQHECHDT